MTRTPSHVHPAIPESPQPSVRAMQERLATELSLRSRVLYTLLLLVDLAIGAVVASLWLTEPDLPTRTHIAFGVLLLIAIVWAVVFGWTLARRKVLLAKHRVVTSRIAVFFCAVFTAGALAVAFTDPDLRQTGLFAAGFGLSLIHI